MPDIVLRHPNLPDQPITVTVRDGEKPSHEYFAAGWVSDTPAEPDTQEN